MITTVINFFLSYLLLYKYATLFVIAYLAALILPLPSNTTLLASSAFASQGYLSITIVFLVAFSANVLGDITGFWLSRKYGKNMLMKTPLATILVSQKYIDMEKVFTKNAGITIFTTRFFGGVGPLVNIVSGFSERISLTQFLLYGIPGEFVYVSFFTMSGYYVGDTWLKLLSPIEIFWIVIGGIVTITLGVVMYRGYRKRITPQKSF